MTAGYFFRRLGTFFLTIWVAATINFVIPRLAPGDPMSAVLGKLEAQGGHVENGAQLIEAYRKMYGLDQPLYIQYLRYLWALAHFDMGYSLVSFPTTVAEIIWGGLPYTIGLLLVSTLVAFVIGILFGALLVWRGTPRSARAIIPLFMVIAPIPYYLLAMLLMFALSFTIPIFPNTGTTAIGRIQQAGFDVGYYLDIGYHAFLPALSIILASIGGWALGMRGMMVTVQGEDYLTLAEAKGLPGRVVFLKYAVRNAMLPLFTGLAISLGFIVSGATLVELIFGFPGVGYRLYSAITSADYTVVSGITFILVLAVAFAILVIDLLYPRLDPRITYSRR